jgi:hypothetical protein
VTKSPITYVPALFTRALLHKGGTKCRMKEAKKIEAGAMLRSRLSAQLQQMLSI